MRAARAVTLFYLSVLSLRFSRTTLIEIAVKSNVEIFESGLRIEFLVNELDRSVV